MHIAILIFDGCNALDAIAVPDRPCCARREPAAAAVTPGP